MAQNGSVLSLVGILWIKFSDPESFNELYPKTIAVW